MSKQKIKKALGGLQLSYNGSPLASLNSNSTLTLQSGQYPYSSQLPASIQDRWNQLGSGFNNKLFGIGLGLSLSGDKDAKQYGQQLVDGYMDQLHQPLFPNDTEQDPNDIYADDVNRLTNSNFNLQSGLDAASQVLGQIPGKVGQVGQKVINTAQKVKSAYSNISEIAALQKKGVKGLKTAKAGNIAAIGGAVSDLVSGFLPEKTEYQGDKGAITQTMDSVYDGISDAAMSFGPVGMMVGGIMKGGKLLGGALNSVGGGTDAMTTTDAILGSSFLNLTPIGLLNGFGGERAQTLTKNDLAFENVGSSYTGTSWSVNDALRKSGKKYGFFSKGALKEANNQIIEARRQQNIMESISDYATDRFDIRNSMAAINGNRRRFNMQGGYNQAAIQVGKNGMSIVKRVVGKYKMQEKLKLHNQQQAYLNSIPDNQTFVTEEIQEANIIPENFKDISELYPYNPNLEKVEEFKEGGTLSNNSFIEEINLSLPYNELKEESIVSTIIEIEPTESVEEFKEGGKLSTIIEEIELNNLVEEFKEGGSIKEENTEYEPENVSDIIKFVNKHKKVNFVQRLKDSFRETIPDWEGNKVATHKLRVELDRGKVKLFPMVQEINDKLYDFTDPKNNHENPVWDALDTAEKNGDVIIFNNLDDAVWFSKNYKQYYPTFEDYAGEPHLKYDEKQNKYIFTYPKDHKATISELEWYNSNDPEAIEFRKHYKYNEETNEYLPILIEFKEGGSFNVIPEGALHARLHHMENDQNITKKGIPVVSTDENGEIEQHAEIEKEEIILRLSLTKRLEELAKENTDEAAIEAGKILVEEILNNTIDNTNTLL